ncbi:MAG TPA: Holliday junction resolvase RuvX [Myxococcota bacterium]|jgi:putative Holliday junction resolvase|nr:Holliday junction resolvase RuvX [Myxococcota bacterium]
MAEAGGVVRAVALDVGGRRIGVAATDELGLTVQPLAFIERGRARAEDLQRILEVVRARGATHLIVGLPLGLRGERGAAARRVEKLVAALRAAAAAATAAPAAGGGAGAPVPVPVPVPVIELCDERFTTVEAERTLVAGGLRREARRAHVDSLAAALLLETWLARRRAAPGPGHE